MLRYILKTTFRDGNNGCEGSKLQTLTDASIVEAALLSGGRSEDSYERTELIGVEIITNDTLASELLHAVKHKEVTP